MLGFCGSRNWGPDRIHPTSPSPTCSGEAVCSLERSARESRRALSSPPTHTSVQLSTETHKESVYTDSLTVCQSPSARFEPTVTFFVSCPVPRDRRTPPASARLTEIRSLASRNSFPVEMQVLKENPIWDPWFKLRAWSNITYEEPLVSWISGVELSGDSSCPAALLRIHHPETYKILLVVSLFKRLVLKLNNDWQLWLWQVQEQTDHYWSEAMKNMEKVCNSMGN